MSTSISNERKPNSKTYYYTQTQTQTDRHPHIHPPTHVHTHTHTHAHTHMHTHTYMHTHTHAHTYMHTNNTHTHTHIHALAQSKIETKTIGHPWDEGVLHDDVPVHQGALPGELTTTVAAYCGPTRPVGPRTTTCIQVRKD